MRKIKEYRVFIGHEEWYTFKVGVGYIPTEKAPEEAVKAMEIVNKSEYMRERL